MSIEEIEAAISQLSPDDLAQLAAWFMEFRVGARDQPDEPKSEQQDQSATARDESPEKRRSNRISGEEVGARGVLRIDDADREARVADLGFGGVGFFLDEAITVPETFYARLHIPPFQDSKLKFRRVYGRPFKQGLVRVGCSFVT
jgi:hypothetical protein